MINRKKLIHKHNPKLYAIDTESPMAVGNGNFAYTADVTGLQTLYNEYLNANAPLCTMSQWGWHTEPAPSERGLYTLDDVKMTDYNCHGYHTSYAVDCISGNEQVYNWLRHNPHRLNLARIYFTWNGNSINSDDISCIHQELDIYTGVLYSDFEIMGHNVSVQTSVSKDVDAVGFSVDSPALCNGLLSVEIGFPYASHKISASDWGSKEKHNTSILSQRGDCLSLKRTLHNDSYYVNISGNVNIACKDTHVFSLEATGKELEFTVIFSPYEITEFFDFNYIIKNSIDNRKEFWEKGGMVELSNSKDPRAFELERRIILSQYLIDIHCTGNLPPQETGLACNSWYGKFHLEMHIIHCGWLPLWNRSELLEKSFEWYLSILDNAKENALRNNYKGARWPKMTGPEGIDSPSRIATLLIWQQPHILYMLELVRKSKQSTKQRDYMIKYFDIVRETADFMVDFVRENKETNKFELVPPVIPAQEEHSPECTLNPVFEVCYWKFGLKLAVEWAKELNEEHCCWQDVYERMVEPPIINGLYPAHENCKNTFDVFNRDHPSMLYGFGFIPCDNIDKSVMENTFHKVIKEWNYNSLWGWDFALMAMTLIRLGMHESVIDILLMDTEKNSYVTSGNNYQRSRNDLPLYLPGNGSLLLAVAMMVAGYGENKGTFGFPDDGMWEVVYENISPLPY